MKPYQRDFTYAGARFLGVVFGVVAWFLIAVPIIRIVGYYYPPGEDFVSPELLAATCVTMLPAPVVVVVGALLGVRGASRFIARRVGG